MTTCACKLSATDTQVLALHLVLVVNIVSNGDGNCCVVTGSCCDAGLTFEGLGFFDVGLAVFLRKYDVLAKHLLIPASNQGATELLRRLLKPVHAS